MANNRMYLRCKSCGAEFFLGKRLLDGYWIEEYAAYKDVPLIDRLNMFYDEHKFCRGAGLDNFEIEYEMEPDYDL